MYNLPRARANRPVEAAHHNSLKAAIEDLDTRVAKANPRTSDDIGVKQSFGGSTFFLKSQSVAPSLQFQPFAVSLVLDESVYYAQVGDGIAIDKLLGYEQIEIPALESDELEVKAGDIVFIEITYPTDDVDEFVYKYAAEADVDFEGYTLSDVTPPDLPLVLVSRFPLAIIEMAGESTEDGLKVVQFCRNNLVQTNVVVDGRQVAYFLSL